MSTPATARAVTDTHALIWYLYGDPKLTPAAKQKFDQAIATGEAILVSTISLIEIVYLLEKGKLDANILQQLIDLFQRVPVFVVVPVDMSVFAALVNHVPRALVPDMPDRIIAATAFAYNLPLISADSNIQQLSTLPIIW